MNTTRSGFNLDGQKGVIEISNGSYLSKSSDSTAIDVLTSLHQYGPKLYEKVTKKRKVSWSLSLGFLFQYRRHEIHNFYYVIDYST